MSNNYSALSTNSLATTTTTATANSATSIKFRHGNKDSCERIMMSRSSGIKQHLALVEHRPSIDQQQYPRPNNDDDGDKDDMHAFVCKEIKTTTCEYYARTGKRKTPPEPCRSPSNLSAGYSPASYDLYRKGHSSPSSDEDCRKHAIVRATDKIRVNRLLERKRSPPSPSISKSTAFKKTSGKPIVRKSPEHIPYFLDAKREKERLRRVYGTASISKNLKKSRRRRSSSSSTPTFSSSALLRHRRERERGRERDREDVYEIRTKSSGHDINLSSRNRYRHGSPEQPQRRHRERPRTPSPYMARSRSRSRSRGKHRSSIRYERSSSRDRRHSSLHSRDNGSSTVPTTQIVTIPVPVPDYSYAFPPWSSTPPPWNTSIPSAHGPSSRYAPYPPPMISMPPMITSGMIPPPPMSYGNGLDPMSPNHNGRIFRYPRYPGPNYALRMPRGTFHYKARNNFLSN